MAEVFYFHVQEDRSIKYKLLEPIMQEDKDVATWRFRIPKALNQIDMSAWSWWFVYVNAKGQKFSELLTLNNDIDDPESFSTADYSIGYGISKTPGGFTFALEAINAEQDGEISGEWHTRTYTHTVTPTLQGNQAEYAETESDIISALMQEVRNKVNQLVGGATPLPVNLKSLMTDHDKVYLYTGSENGESTGYWYYWNGTDFVPGGLYGAGVQIDPTLSQSGQAADAKAVGDNISTVLAQIPIIDSIPTQGSTNAVSSGGVYESINEISGDINDLKSDLTQVQDVLEITEDIKATVNVEGKTIIINPVTLHVGDTVTWTISSAISNPVYCYVYDNQGERLTSRSISAGQTSASVTLTDLAENGYISALCNTPVNVTAEVIPAIQPENRIDEIENSINTLSENIDNISNESVVSGYDLKSESGVETGAGAYYWSGGRPYLNTSGSYVTDYTYFIFPVNKNSVYSVSVTPRWLILVDENGGKVTEDVTGKMIQTGNAVKLYITISNAYVSSFAISEGYLANKVIKKALSIETQTESHHGNSMAMDTMYFTIGMPEKLHYNNILALPSDKLECITSCDGQDSHDEKGISITPVRTFSNANNAVRMFQYDNDLNLIYQPDNTGLVIKSMALRDCSAIVIGDSTVGSWGLMTEQMLKVFDDNNKTLTLLGTQHSGGTDERNMHEGRGGWSAKAYCTEATHGVYTNPFLNNGHFDFSYYMQQQGYSVPDFVVIQLGINDVSNIRMSEFKTVSEQALMYEKEMIDSILAYNSNIKVLINPPTTPTTDQSKLSMYYETTIFRNLVIRYAMMLRRLATQYSSNKVRCSNNNLILDSSTDIRDSVHPTDDGFVKLGNEVVNQFNCWF